VEFTTRLQPDAGFVWGSEGRLKQVVINLLFNACDALTEDGCVTVTTARTIGTQAEKGGNQPQSGEFVEIAVSDNGTGIAASELKKIFDPFYTTKPPGKGTGLGLPVSLRIVESLGGTIHVESIEGKGTVFSVKLKPWTPDHDA
jgi:signal transduction histidine kinase